MPPTLCPTDHRDEPRTNGQVRDFAEHVEQLVDGHAVDVPRRGRALAGLTLEDDQIAVVGMIAEPKRLRRAGLTALGP
ncbi:hypothetical protein [Nonomuraea angiospora]